MNLICSNFSASKLIFRVRLTKIFEKSKIIVEVKKLFLNVIK